MSDPSDWCIHRLFEEQARRTPHRPALIFFDEALTYAELDARAERIARHLRGASVGAEVLVPICTRRSFEMIAGILGILKAGGAYVPLDPDDPQDRLAFMLDDVETSVMVARSDVLDRLPPNRPRTIVLDAEVLSEPGDPPPARGTAAHPGSAAYAIYTSGSTGRPKAALNEHRSVCNRLVWAVETFGFSDSDRVLQKTTYAFDVSVWEMFCPLTSGGTLVIAPPGAHRDPQAVADLIAEERITIVHFVPSMLELFLEARGLERCRDLRAVLCSGEALRPDLVRKFFAKLPVELHNLYGPTEAAIDVSWHRYDPDHVEDFVTIGKPIANTFLYVVDEDLRQVPDGVAGELLIGGRPVARGYVNRPELTAQRFLPDPFSPAEGARIYRTGDRVRRQPDGAFEFMGRIDHQLKVRGLRIEPAEIEAALVVHPAVRQAVAMGADFQRVKAYLVLDEDAEPPGDDVLRRHLARTLPDYMIPSAFVIVPSIPLTPSGKIDRAALREGSSAVSANRSSSPGEPRNEIEKSILAIWKDLLREERIGVHDNFFECGGHSLLVVEMFVRVEGLTGVRIPVSTIFHAATVADLAQEIQRRAPEEAAGAIVPLQTGGSAPPLYCIPGAGGHVFMYREMPQLLGTGQPLYGLQLQNLYGRTGALRSVESIARALIEEIDEVGDGRPVRLAGYSFGGLVAYEMAQQLAARGDEVDFLALFDTWVPGAANEAPLSVRARRNWRALRSLSHAERYDYLATRLEVRLAPWVQQLRRIRDRLVGGDASLVYRLEQARLLCLRAERAYSPQAYPGKIWLFRASDLEGVPTDPTDRTNGWSYVASDVEVVDIACGHRDLYTPANISTLSARLAKTLRDDGQR